MANNFHSTTLQGNDAVVLVAKHGDRCAGCVKIEELEDGDAEVGMFAVDPDFQSSGIGRALLDAAHNFAKEVLDAKSTGVMCAIVCVRVMGCVRLCAIVRVFVCVCVCFCEIDFRGSHKRAGLQLFVVEAPT
jgi:GNAT superfamily N-acetyltransferase